MADIRSRPSTDTYRENWDRIFGKPAPKRNRLEWVNNNHRRCPYPGCIASQCEGGHYIAYDDHPAAD